MFWQRLVSIVIFCFGDLAIKKGVLYSLGVARTKNRYMQRRIDSCE